MYITVKPLIAPAGTILFLDPLGRVSFKGVYYSRAGTIEPFQNYTPKSSQNHYIWPFSISDLTILASLRVLFEGGHYSTEEGKRCGYNSRAGTIKGRVQLKVLRYLKLAKSV